MYSYTETPEAFTQQRFPARICRRILEPVARECPSGPLGALWWNPGNILVSDLFSPRKREKKKKPFFFFSFSLSSCQIGCPTLWCSPSSKSRTVLAHFGSMLSPSRPSIEGHACTAQECVHFSTTQNIQYMRHCVMHCPAPQRAHSSTATLYHSGQYLWHCIRYYSLLHSMHTLLT